jgi:uncharacterized Zn-binding protein involved in type VI secretion
MPVTVKVNGASNSLVHKGSNHISMATVPDVCKTPSPGGPVPIPYPNISQSATLAKGTTTVKADGMMAAIKGSEFSLSNGDEPGVAGGVKSSTFIKESTWILYSFDVKMDGQNACRLTDKKFQNHENTADLGGAVGPPVVVAQTTLEPPGDCTPQRYAELNARVKKMKKHVATVGSKCSPEDSPAALRVKTQANQDLADAREARENACFRGGDAGHKKQIKKLRDQARRCHYMRTHNGKLPRWPGI